MSRNLANFGDSVHWGQGLNDRDKFANIVAHSLGLTLQMEAHSGARIGINEDCDGATDDNEVPFACPTTLQKVRNYTGNPSSAGLVLLNGGINDVTVQAIINPFTRVDDLTRSVQKYCRREMAKLLVEVLTKFSDPGTRIVLTSYFPIFSPASDFGKIRGYLIGNLVRIPQGANLRAQRDLIVNRVVENAQVFWRESTAQLKLAIRDAGSSRIRFAEVPFEDDNAMFADNPWLFEVHLKGGQLVPEDPLAERRRLACNRFHRNPLDRAACFIASAGHPNRLGSEKFAETILLQARP
jgi:hypothetical protein